MTAGSASGGIFGGLFDGEKRLLSNEQREQQLLQSQVPLTILRVDKIVDKPGGFSAIQIAQVSSVVVKGC